MTIQVGNALVSWGIHEFEDTGAKFPFARVLDEIAETGYAGLDLGPWGFLPTDPVALRPELEKRHLQLPSSFVPVNLLDGNADTEAHVLKVGRLLAAMGGTVMVLADGDRTNTELIKHAGQRKGSLLSSDQWDVYAAGVNRIAYKVHDELGLKTVFHHHCGSYVETPDEVRELMRRTDADRVGLCLDTGHWHYAGGDALQCIQQYGERIRYLHLKDCDLNIRELCVKEKLDYFEATQAGVFCELGKGGVDFPAVLVEMDRFGYNGWAIVEQDVLTDDLETPRRSARRSRDYLRKLGL